MPLEVAQKYYVNSHDEEARFKNMYEGLLGGYSEEPATLPSHDVSI